MDLEEAIEKGLIEEIESDRKLVEEELKESERDLQKAEKDFEDGDYKWCIVSAYYSMFHMTKAVMFGGDTGRKDTSQFWFFLTS